MNLPKVISKATLAKIAPNDTHAVRVVLQEVSNPGPYRLRCRNREYIFTKNATIGRHALEIPVSAWMYGVGSRALKAIADDFRTGSGPPFSVHIVELRESLPDVFASNALDQVRLLLSVLGAPDVVVKAFEFIDNRDLGGLLDHVAQFAASEDEEPEETPAQAQARKMREAKAKKKAQLQPA